MARLPLVIINPSSRGGRGGSDWPLAAVALRAHFGSFEPRFTESPGHAASIAREEASRGRALIVTFGGDGTVSETAHGIVESGRPCELGVLPHGTGADFIRTLGMPRRLADAARVIRDGRAVSVDVGEVTFSDGSRTTFVNSASFGLSAEVAARVNRSPEAKRSGRRAFLSTSVEAAKRFGVRAVLLRIEGKQRWVRARITNVSLHNGRYFGGGMKMAPRASLSDGKLDAVFVRGVPLHRMVMEMPLLFLGAHERLADVQSVALQHLEARPESTSQHLIVEVDGEIAGELPARFAIRHRILRVRTPRTSA